MGQNNRQRRAAKQRERARKQRRVPTAGWDASEFDRDAFAAGAASLFLGRMLRRRARGHESPLDLQDFQRCAERHQQAAVDEQFSYAVDALLRAGWTPLDLHEVVRRKTSGNAGTHLLDVVAESTARHPAHLVHPQWRAQLDQLGATVRAAAVSPAYAWGRRAGLDWPSAAEALIAVLGVICALPVVPTVLPAPGTAGGQGEVDGVDVKVLRRVRGLLAKAESTEHAEEADALTTKAQELMTRYSVERALAESTQPVTAGPVSRRLWLESPYVDAKALLVEVVAQANNCRAIQSSALGFVALVGHAAELDVVELLVTSLLLQATRAMTLAGPQSSRYGTSRTRSFRQSFLVAYANRIGERLRASAHDVQSTVDSDNAGALVPVLAARRDRVDDTVAELFPDLVERRVSVTNAAGYGAGRAAADLALFDVHDALRARAG